MYDVLIIGCGITGAATAFWLSRYKLRLGILERENDVATGTTKANSAILHAGYDPEPGTLMAKFNVRGVQLAAEICPKLDVPYKACGSLVLAFSDEQCETLEELYRRGVHNGVRDMVILRADEVRSFEPNVSENVVAALYAPSAAICSPWEFCLALAETAVRNDADLHLSTEVTGLHHEEEGGFWRVDTNKGTFYSRYVINAAGVDAQKVHEMGAPHTFTILPSRGQYHLLDKTQGDRVSHVIFQCPDERGKGVLVSPTVHGNLIVGPSAEPVEGDDTATTSEGLKSVSEAALLSVPSIRFNQTIRSFAGVRARSDRGDFIIDWAAPGLLDLAGICSPGLSACLAIGEYATQLIGDEGLSLREKEDFICERHKVRFRDLSPEEREELVKSDPAYGHVICRCETVTEGEILKTFKEPIPPCSVDGIKRRVNTGMGRCQGGFCGPRVVEILSRSLGISPGEVVQDKEGSRMLLDETKGGKRDV